MEITDGFMFFRMWHCDRSAVRSTSRIHIYVPMVLSVPWEILLSLAAISSLLCHEVVTLGVTNGSASFRYVVKLYDFGGTCCVSRDVVRWLFIIPQFKFGGLGERSYIWRLYRWRLLFWSREEKGGGLNIALHDHSHFVNYPIFSPSYLISLNTVLLLSSNRLGYFKILSTP